MEYDRHQPQLSPEPQTFGAARLPMHRTLTQFLNDLKVGERLTVDKYGAPISSAQQARGEGQVTFEKTAEGDFRVRDGRPSLNGTYIYDPQDTPHQLQHSIVVPGGTKVGFSLTVSITLLNHEAFDEEASASGQLVAEAIRRMAVGAKVVVGRNPKCCDVVLSEECVSRVHATIERLPDAEGAGGAERLYRISEGARSTRGTYLKGENGTWLPIEGWVTVSAGQLLRFGAEAKGYLFEVPESKEKRQLAAEYHAEDLEGSLMSIDSSLDQSLGGDSSLHSRDPVADRRRLTVRPNQARVLGSYIREGLERLREALSLFEPAKAADEPPAADAELDRGAALRQYHLFQEVCRHFSNEAALRACGFSFSEGNVFQLKDLSPREVSKTLTRIAERSWFLRGHTVQPSYGWLPDNFSFEQASAQELSMAREFLREVCLVYAEEWIHAYQHALGQNVSRKGVFFRGLDALEYDVAQYLREQRIEMSKNYRARYEREVELEKVKGIQTLGEIKKISERLAALPPGRRFRSAAAGIFMFRRRTHSAILWNTRAWSS